MLQIYVIRLYALFSAVQAIINVEIILESAILLLIVILISASQVVVSKTITHVAQPSIVRKISSQMNKMPSKPIFSSASAFVL